MTGRIDVHSHLLPGIDDGCQSLEESLRCAAAMVAAGYTDSFCTPHYWPNLGNTIPAVRQRVDQLQWHLDEAEIPLKLHPGGEIALRPEMTSADVAELPTYGAKGEYLLCELWADVLPKWFEPVIRRIQSAGVTVILAHPERMRAVQDEPELADYFADLGLLLQGNLQCLADPVTAPTRRTADRFITEGRYFMLGSDLHRLDTLPIRLAGLNRAVAILGEDQSRTMTVDHPGRLMG